MKKTTRAFWTERKYLDLLGRTGGSVLSEENHTTLVSVDSSSCLTSGSLIPGILGEYDKTMGCVYIENVNTSPHLILHSIQVGHTLKTLYRVPF